MKTSRKQHVKEVLAARRKSYDFLAKQRKIEFLTSQMKARRANLTNRVIFNFSPEELGIPVRPSDEDVQKLGLKRALHRLNREDFHMSYPYNMDEPVTSESFSRHRADVLAQIKTTAFNASLATAAASVQVEL